MPVVESNASLASMPEMLTEDHLVALGVAAKHTLQNWRSKRFGPPFTKLSYKNVRYPKDKLISWLESNLVDTTAE